MNCCTNCFADSEIKAIIESDRINGDCDFCNSKNVSIYEIGKDTRLSELLNDVLDVYTPISSLPLPFSGVVALPLSETLYQNWNIFSLKPNKIHALIREICADRYNDTPDLFSDSVIVLQSTDADYMDNNSVLRNSNWNNFLESIKHNNRFHNDDINKDILTTFLECIKKTYPIGSVFYRARICPNSSGYPVRSMGAPPKEKASAGRVNAEGIQVLYLADNYETTFYEARATMYDFITIGRFDLKQKIEIVNLAAIDSISPFIGFRYGFDFIQYAINFDHLKMIAQEIARPLRRQDSILDYIPTQYISDFIKSRNFNGIEYISTMHKGGKNLAVFDETLFDCVEVHTYTVDAIRYEHTIV